MWFWILFFGLHLVIAAGFIARVLYSREESSEMLVWIVFLLFAPYVGAMFYAISGRYRIRRKNRLKTSVDKNRFAFEAIHDSEVPQEWAVVARVAHELTSMPPTKGNAIDFFNEQNISYDAIIEAIRAAKHHVHMEYFAFHADEAGSRFRDILVEKAKEGVECRLLLDSVGCFFLKTEFTAPLRDAGVELEFFLPVSRILARWSWHLRSHRKIVVIDGTTAFLGSQNIGDESKRNKLFQPWRDVHLRIRGPVVQYVQRAFLEDWTFAKDEPLDPGPYLETPEHHGKYILQLLPTGPDTESKNLEAVLLAAFTSARDHIEIVTPYFAPSPIVRMGLLSASYRGVKVSLILPRNCDMRVAYWAGRSYYDELLKAGLRIWEMDTGMVHSKIVAIDRSWCMMGSANMDVRSFQVNFEISVLGYDKEFAELLSDQVEAYRKESTEITLKEMKRRPRWDHIVEGACRLFTPLV